MRQSPDIAKGRVATSARGESRQVHSLDEKFLHIKQIHVLMHFLRPFIDEFELLHEDVGIDVSDLGILNCPMSGLLR